MLCDDPEPDVGQEVTFEAVVQGFIEENTGIAQSEETADLPIFWEFGDGETGFGSVVTHAYEEEGCYDVFMIVLPLAECDFTVIKTICVGGTIDDRQDREDGLGGDFFVEIIPDPDARTEPGGEIGLSLVTDSFSPITDVFWFIPHAETKDGEFSEDVAELTDELSETTTLLANVPGVVVVAAEVYNAAGEVGFAFVIIVVCDDGAADGTCLACLIVPQFEPIEVGQPYIPELICVGDLVDLSFAWSIDFLDPPDMDVSLSDTRAERPAVVAADPGFYGLVVQVGNAAGASTFAFGAVEIGHRNFNDIFVEILGPFDGPVGEFAPLDAFIEGGRDTLFCSWQIVGLADEDRVAPGEFDQGDDREQQNGSFGPPPVDIFNPFNCFGAEIIFHQPDCVDVELFVEDATGAVGFDVLTICSFDDFHFDCPFDDFCDPQCDGFDPDCEDPCPFDFVCDEDCPIGDPDCFDFEFCVPGDFICDDFCVEFGAPDPDCALCAPEGHCVDFCPQPDPDCDRDFCIGGDGICDPFCDPPDMDCGEEFCQADGFCDQGCGPEDPDCGTTNDEICSRTGFCCAADPFCDFGCPQPDPDCGACSTQPDGHCLVGCDPPDPDCQDLGFCGDGLCQDGPEDCFFCPEDCGFCDEQCDFDAQCDNFDPCTFDFCFDGFCFHEFNPQCEQGCFDDFDCDDFNECTIDFCDQGFCFHQGVPDCAADCLGDFDCDDFDDCTFDFCDFASGKCLFGDNPDCFGFCGDGVCDVQLGEDSANCGDCFCGDGICDPAEPLDCEDCL